MTHYYIDYYASSGKLNGVWTFTNGNNSVTALGGSNPDADVKLSSGDYIRVSDNSSQRGGWEPWYEVQTVVNSGSLGLASIWRGTTTIDSSSNTLFNSGSGLQRGNPNTSGVALCTPEQYIEGSHATGDIGYVRSNQTFILPGTDTNTSSTGGVDDLIEVRGAIGNDDVWGDGNDIRPIIDCDHPNGDWQVRTTNTCWKFTGLVIYNSDDSTGAFSFGDLNVFIENCWISGNHSDGIGIGSQHTGHIKDCKFWSNSDKHITISGDGHLYVQGCEFYSGNQGTDYCTSIAAGDYVSFLNCDFNGLYGTTPIYLLKYSRCYMRNCRMDDDVGIQPGAQACIECVSEDHNNIRGYNYAWLHAGTVASSTTSITRPGGGSTSFVMFIDDSIGTGKYRGYRFSLKEILVNDDIHGPFVIWCDADTETTIDIYAMISGTWTNMPTSSQSYTETWYFSGGNYLKAQSSGSFSDPDANDWKKFSTTFTPSEDGWSYTDFFMGGNCGSDNDDKIYLDITPVVS